MRPYRGSRHSLDLLVLYLRADSLRLSCGLLRRSGAGMRAKAGMRPGAGGRDGIRNAGGLGTDEPLSSPP